MNIYIYINQKSYFVESIGGHLAPFPIGELNPKFHLLYYIHLFLCEVKNEACFFFFLLNV